MPLAAVVMKPMSKMLVVVGVGSLALLGCSTTGTVSTSSTSIASSAPTSSAPQQGVTTVPATTVPEATTGALDTTTTPNPTTSTIVAENDRVGWHVTGVAVGDVLNVRSGPSASAPIVGSIAHDGDRVELLPRARNRVGESAWYGVRLEDGTEGFVNSRFLTRPSSWEAGIATVPCVTHSSDGDLTAVTAASGDASAVVGLFEFPVADCDRYVIVLGVDSVDEFQTANTLGGGDVRVTSGGTRVTVALPSTITGVAPQATNADFNNALALTVLPISESNSDLEVRFLHSSSRLAGITILSNPARILIDVIPAPTGTGLDYAPIVGDGTILEHPVDPSSDKLGVSRQVTVTGYGRFFEAQGYATLTSPDGSAPTDIQWSGPSIFFTDGGMAGVYALWWPTWGEFTFNLDLTAGSYEIFVGDDCMTEIDDTSIPCGVTDTFDVAP